MRKNKTIMRQAKDYGAKLNKKGKKIIAVEDLEAF